MWDRGGEFMDSVINGTIEFKIGVCGFNIINMLEIGGIKNTYPISLPPF